MKLFASLLVAVPLLLTSCGTFGPRPKTVYTRTDLDSKVSKLIVFPVTDFSGRQTASSKKMDTAVVSAWSDLYGKDKVIAGGPILYKMIQKFGKESYQKLISAADNVSAVEQLHKDKRIRNFVKKVTSKFGNFHFAFALTQGGKKSYDNGKPVYLNIGLFDSANMTWNWITKIEDKKGSLSFGGYDGASMSMVSNSFDLIKDLASKERMPASKK